MENWIHERHHPLRPGAANGQSGHFHRRNMDMVARLGGNVTMTQKSINGVGIALSPSGNFILSTGIELPCDLKGLKLLKRILHAQQATGQVAEQRQVNMWIKQDRATLAQEIEAFKAKRKVDVARQDDERRATMFAGINLAELDL
jgi:hypothetical protein